MYSTSYLNYFVAGVAVVPAGALAAGLAALAPCAAGLLLLECFFTCGLVWAGAGAAFDFAGAGVAAPDCARAAAAVNIETKINFFISWSFSSFA